MVGIEESSSYSSSPIFKFLGKDMVTLPVHRIDFMEQVLRRAKSEVGSKCSDQDQDQDLIYVLDFKKSEK
jgi:hypothetical protein